jgi:hypothetical protein
MVKKCSPFGSSEGDYSFKSPRSNHALFFIIEFNPAAIMNQSKIDPTHVNRMLDPGQKEGAAPSPGYPTLPTRTLA